MKTSYHNPHLPPRRSHRKRCSVSRLSSDSVPTLPEYSSPPISPTTPQPGLFDGGDSDNPPDYLSSTDDGEGDIEEHPDIPYVSRCLAQAPKRRSLAYTRRRKRAPLPPPPNASLDTLLERSIDALEKSTALLQSSMFTQAGPSTVLSPVENEPDRTLEVRARNLSTRMRVNSGVHTSWMDHLEELSRGVDCLLNANSPMDDGTLSRSLPTFTVPHLRPRRKPSLLELNGSSSSSSQLQYSLPNRDLLVAPPPRAMTQYVESTMDPELVVFPSTLGLRASQSSHHADLRCRSPEHLVQTLPSQCSACTSENTSDIATSAYHLLSNLAKQFDMVSHPSYRFWGSRPRRRSAGTSETLTKPLDGATSFSPNRSQSGHVSPPLSRSSSPHRRPSSTPLPQASPREEFSDTSSDSSSSSDHPTGYRAMESLRRILHENPSSASVNHLLRSSTNIPRFHPVTPPTPLSATSTATASVSRLLTKGRHSLSTRPPSPPPHSSLKVRSGPPTPARSPSALSVADILGSGVARAFGSGPSSSASTPKRISFAELPEPYSSSRPTSARFRDKNGKKKDKMGGEAGGSTGFVTWLLKEWISSPTPKWQDERFEERWSRGWGSRPGYGMPDDWAV